MAGYAQFLGLASAILIVLQWAPQIYTTWKLKSQGSLSIMMLLLQIPGALLVIFFQGVVNKADPTTWAPYVFGCIEQIILVAMCAAFYFRNRNRTPSTIASETESLLVVKTAEDDATASTYQQQRKSSEDSINVDTSEFNMR